MRKVIYDDDVHPKKLFDLLTEKVEDIVNRVITKAEICEALGVTRGEFETWRKEYPTFERAYLLGMECAEAACEKDYKRLSLGLLGRNASAAAFNSFMKANFKTDYGDEKKITIEGTLRFEHLTEQELLVTINERLKGLSFEDKKLLFAGNDAIEAEFTEVMDAN